MASGQIALTPELVALCWRQEPEPDTDAYGRVWLTDDDYEEIADELCKASPEDSLWIFAYGSLIWKPGFTAVDHRRATAFGWHRSFCIELQSWRGTPEQPGLMMALDRGGRCDGVAYRCADADKRNAILSLLKREIGFRESLDAVRWIPIVLDGRTIRALVFYAGPRGDGIHRRLPLDEVARRLARACGHIGSGADYLYQTVAKLDEFGIRDRNLWRLQALVAGEIKTLHGLATPPVGET